MNCPCTHCGKSFAVTKDDLHFYDTISPVFGGKKCAVPPPTHCPACRHQRRLGAFSQIHVYRRPSSVTGNMIVAQFPDSVAFPVYDNEYWWSDKWDALSYGRTFDFSQPFFAQFRMLSDVVPRFALMVLRNENCDYCNNVSDNKNCYLIFNTRRSEDCMSCERVVGSRDCVDCTDVSDSELCFDCVSCNRCYNVQSSRESDDCKDSMFLMNCRSCTDCFGCVNLRHARFCVFNEQKSEQEYRAFLAVIGLSSHVKRTAMEKKVEIFWQQHPRPHAVMKMVQDVSGKHLFECRDLYQSYLLPNCYHLRYCSLVVDNVRNCQDYTTYGDNAELIYETTRCGNNIFRLLFCHYTYDSCADLQYCSFCVGCQQCFGCIGLRSKKYCVFNKQYTKEKYEELVPRIIEHMRATSEWGEFFPLQDSVFAYNHSMAQRYFPLTKEQAKQKGLPWYDEQSDGIAESDIPDGFPAADVSLQLRSTLSGRVFSVTAQEMRRYRKLGVPLPRMTYDERMEKRAEKLGGIVLFDRTCAKNGKPMQTTIPPDSPWIVWEKDTYETHFSS